MQISRSITGLFLVASFFSVACQSESSREAERRREEQDRNSAAYKMGQAAHEVARGAAKVAGEAARKLDEDAAKAREGWKEQERKDRRTAPRQ